MRVRPPHWSDQAPTPRNFKCHERPSAVNIQNLNLVDYKAGMRRGFYKHIGCPQESRELGETLTVRFSR